MLGIFPEPKEESQESFSALNQCMVELQEKGKIIWKMNTSKALQLGFVKGWLNPPNMFF